MYKIVSINESPSIVDFSLNSKLLRSAKSALEHYVPRLRRKKYNKKRQIAPLGLRNERRGDISTTENSEVKTIKICLGYLKDNFLKIQNNKLLIQTNSFSKHDSLRGEIDFKSLEPSTLGGDQKCPGKFIMFTNIFFENLFKGYSFELSETFFIEYGNLTQVNELIIVPNFYSIEVFKNGNNQNNVENKEDRRDNENRDNVDLTLFEMYSL